ncbi:MAG: 50S ribosomal protein L15 [Candidatus Magasanikbacteria bacterium RIFCSPHIGHO2_01_FULL_41_23]|uniref:Large ribosomal subunit protein uL15 n=1 Tax=Candidatus Magasanikbacteria bacterium RIFCSPLOWO2_01_FULL_40_15 TaxID=1798686 RepID=A0A1F6N289_9BACT|nr:MAG: 50S ribosomal protein L15 [Candidatus Magasanikbacteria bacterium RIFCSPHIGHO2_01_FULL_41_23]OGH66826.1 MAG: 50S ribosomal protein L15 [Candidatus Magasanikbacteria bacterium RIFCSPHIGHO2_02_FULL_41_35]OGH76655.1 MAG: 50S ribosomal protein L15 [Candidatus Magasanikbacteria bacterium RIFCSPHIGHO2_12_FULL_41_16]OGH77991.1 MAG: 50S ribosomal protein L15 [Candidatus Magasanikbacteria bacterium RIFCSPLOWO2_01_FULL_40_15]
MPLAPHTLSSQRTKSAKRVGRGNASQKGTTAGRGTKGQKSRSGGRGGLKLKGLRKNIMKIPKLRGFKSFKPQAQTVTLARIEAMVKADQFVTPKWLVAAHIVSSAVLPVKIVATGKITKPVIIKDCLVSKGALAAIEKAGGKIVS